MLWFVDGSGGESQLKTLSRNSSPKIMCKVRVGTDEVRV